MDTSLNARPQRDGDSIVLAMRCRDKAEAALIVNEMVDLFLASQGAAKRAGVAEKLARINEQMDSVQKELTYAENMLDDVRRRYGAHVRFVTRGRRQ